MERSWLRGANTNTHNDNNNVRQSNFAVEGWLSNHKVDGPQGGGSPECAGKVGLLAFRF